MVRFHPSPTKETLSNQCNASFEAYIGSKSLRLHIAVVGGIIIMEGKKKKLVMTLPEGLKDALNRKFYGAPHTHEEIAKSYYVLTKLYERYKKYTKKENHLLNVEWEEKNIEAHFQSNRWYYAHYRLKKYKGIIEELHKAMFQLLVRFDKNPPEEFSQFDSLSAEEIYDEFKGKYIE